jgi:hypothetical protein
MSAIEHPGYAISTDPQRLDVLMVHAYLTQSAWSPGIPIEVLATKDAHGLYQQFEFSALANPSRIMEILQPDVYLPV